MSDGPLNNAGAPGDSGLSAAEWAHVEKLFDAELDALLTPEQVADFINASPVGGDLKVKAVYGDDGKNFAIELLNSDGTTVPANERFPNTTEGLKAGLRLMASLVPLVQKLQHLYEQAQKLKAAHSNVSTDARLVEAQQEVVALFKRLQLSRSGPSSEL